MNIKNKNLTQIHLAVFLFGIAGLFGKLISLPPMIIVLGRVFFSSIFLFVVMLFLKKDIKLKKKKDYVYLTIMGLILAIHWSAFFKSIQVSTVAIGLLIFSTFPVFVTFLEPYFFKEKIVKRDIIIAIITLLGVMLVVPKFKLGDNLTQGVLWGVLSSFTYAILSMLNRKYVKEYSSIVIAFYEQFVATLVLIPFLFLIKPIFKPRDIFLLILLGIVFTAISHTLFINGLKSVKTQTAGIISSLEPVYGIVFALLIIGEVPTLREISGGIIILGTAFYSTIKSQ
ncbi:DMT family transporter [Clostridium tagluense]|uniref:DMT family transporter n=1 Tax=Clostridium tagluense TaxID=360422 RepID=UPI001CF169CA|nr:DMT family transporter [Clostridium tagluense]MCB2310696.1 DMT family transporter [Clostridium tagluense]MCB2315574.1 DMT family transporter [Clostridium tagluense]MCB2320428.1 DMT family transporter [Clostridium tagluense]MCB2325289.1 DMT family transporter [Clostridium tagluense]MCB2330141.1 DMT family transporter [Clostridium tagluense]